jgi:cobalt transporter subunit CbtA
MPLFRTIVFAAALAGLLGGALLTILQQFGTVPLIVEAERFETATFAASAPAAGGHGHHHGAEAWASQDGLERTGYTLLSNIITGVAFALLLVAGFTVSGRAITWREGLLWGIGGFAVFALTPSLGLPPELPGMAASELGARQLWWAGTAVATAVGLCLLAFRCSPLWAVVAVALLVAPHLIGAPHPAEVHDHVPHLLAHRFVVTVIVTSFLFWLALGALSAWFFDRLGHGREPARAI